MEDSLNDSLNKLKKRIKEELKVRVLYEVKCVELECSEISGTLSEVGRVVISEMGGVVIV